jgi:hypothetical protein
MELKMISLPKVGDIYYLVVGNRETWTVNDRESGGPLAEATGACCLDGDDLCGNHFGFVVRNEETGEEMIKEAQRLARIIYSKKCEFWKTPRANEMVEVGFHKKRRKYTYELHHVPQIEVVYGDDQVMLRIAPPEEYDSEDHLNEDGTITVTGKIAVGLKIVGDFADMRYEEYLSVGESQFANCRELMEIRKRRLTEAGIYFDEPYGFGFSKTIRIFGDPDTINPVLDAAMAEWVGVAEAKLAELQKLASEASERLSLKTRKKVTLEVRGEEHYMFFRVSISITDVDDSTFIYTESLKGRHTSGSEKWAHDVLVTWAELDESEDVLLTRIERYENEKRRSNLPHL